MTTTRTASRKSKLSARELANWAKDFKLDTEPKGVSWHRSNRVLKAWEKEGKLYVTKHPCPIRGVYGFSLDREQIAKLDQAFKAGRAFLKAQTGQTWYQCPEEHAKNMALLARGYAMGMIHWGND